jgi:hypothetical protein
MTHPHRLDTWPGNPFGHHPPLKADALGFYSLVIRLETNQPFIDLGDIYTIDGLSGIFQCGQKGREMSGNQNVLPVMDANCGFRVGASHRCTQPRGHISPHQMIQTSERGATR